jgi:Na+/proline symporter
MSGIDALIVAAYLLYSIYSGLRYRESASTGLEEYFLAGRSLSGWQAGISMAATQFAADTPLLVTGLIATGGVFALWRIWIYAIAFLMMGFLLAPSWRRAGVLTDAELSELRYGRGSGSALRAIKALYFGTVFNCTVLAMVLLAATRIAEPFLLWHDWLAPWAMDPLVRFVEWVGVPFTSNAGAADVWVRSASNLLSIGAIVAVTTFYSATGGLRSVVKTDLLQFAIAIVASVVFAWCVIDKAGGLDRLHVLLTERFAAPQGPGHISAMQILAFTPDWAKDASAGVLAVISLQWLIQLNADGTGYLAQRSMACRSDGEAKTAALVFTFAQIVVRSLIWLPLGLGLLVLFPPDASLGEAGFVARREFTFVRGIAEVLPPGLRGLMLVGMLAALASTLDTHLNWGSSYWTNDIYKRFVCERWLMRKPSQRSLVWVARLSNLLILALAFAILPALSSIQKAWQVSLLLGSGMGVMLVLRWIWWRINAWGELACIVASAITAPIALLFIPEGWDAVRLLTVALVATGAGIIASLATAPVDKTCLSEFYQKARPPGFWGPIARGSHGEEAVDRLKRGFAATLAAALTVFFLLAGLGTWIIGSPAHAWFPWRGAWIAVLLLAAGAACPVWLSLGFEAKEDAVTPRWTPKTGQ